MIMASTKLRVGPKPRACFNGLLVGRQFFDSNHSRSGASGTLRARGGATAAHAVQQYAEIEPYRWGKGQRVLGLPPKPPDT